MNRSHKPLLYTFFIVDHNAIWVFNKIYDLVQTLAIAAICHLL